MKRLFSGLLAATLLVLAAGTGTSFAKENKPEVIRIGTSGGGYGKPVTTMLLGIVQTKGLYEEEFRKDGIKIEWNVFKGSGPAINEAFANGNIDVASYGDFPSIIGRAGGLPTKLVHSSYKRTEQYVFVPADSPAKTVKDLKGKRVALGKGTNAEPAFIKILGLYGLTEKDVRLVNVSSGDAKAALAAKDVDAVVGGSDLFSARNLGLAKILFSTDATKVDPDVQAQGAFFVTEKFAKQYPDIVKRLVKINIKSAAWAANPKNKTKVFEVWAKSGVPQSNYKESFANRTIADYLDPIVDDFHTGHYKRLVEWAKGKGYIRKAFDVDKWVDLSYQQAAVKELKVEGLWAEADSFGRPKK